MQKISAKKQKVKTKLEPNGNHRMEKHKNQNKNLTGYAQQQNSDRRINTSMINQ